ncbi:MAG: helix-turn-helix domain-containing protein [Bacteroides sp.]|nr:helix-turn-helix domain-containing protein [Bacteroides sp.]
MKYILWFTMIMMGVLCNANTCNIKKDTDGFIWILKDNSINRYDGKHLKLYLSDLKNASLFSDNRNRIWVATTDGKLFYYDTFSDCYKAVKGIGQTEQIYTIDNNNNSWFGIRNELHIYNPDMKKVYQFKLNYGRVLTVLPLSSDKYFVATSSGLYLFRFSHGVMTCISKELSRGKCTHITQLCYHSESRKLFIEDEEAGLSVYECTINRFSTIDTRSFSSSIACIRCFDEESILAITNNAMVYRLNISDYNGHLYADVNLYSSDVQYIHGIRDVWVDERKRIWLVDNPLGIMVIDELPMKCNWMQHEQKTSLQAEITDQRLHRIYCINHQRCHPEKGTYIANVSGTSLVWHSRSVSKKSPEKYPSIYLDELIIHNHRIYPGEKNSPLKQSLRHTKVLPLSYDENTFTIKAVSPAFDYPSDLVYTWKLGNGEWSEPSTEGNITCTNLSPGKHELCVRTLSAESGEPIDQRNILIMVRPPFWKTSGAYTIYSFLSILLGLGILKRTTLKTKVDTFPETEDKKEETPKEISYTNPKKNSDIEFMEKVDQLIEENLTLSKININKMAGVMHMSRTSFYNKVKTLTHQSPQEYIHNYKMQRAVHLLSAEKDVRISEIADALGFADLKYFRLVFKKYHGVSPSDYKKQHDKEKNG